MSRASRWGVALGWLVACQSPAAPPVAAPPLAPQTASATPPAPRPAQVSESPPDVALLDPLETTVPYVAPAVPPAGSFANRAASCGRDAPLRKAPEACSSPSGALALLRDTLLLATSPQEEDPDCDSPFYGRDRIAKRFRGAFYARDAKEKRQLDVKLRQLEACSGFAPGAVRLLRAHYRPECADKLARGLNSEAPSNVRWALAGLAICSRIEQLPLQLPAYATSMREDQTTRFVTEKMVPWAHERAAKLDAASKLVDALPDGSYARGIAELELATRWSELVDKLSQVQLDDVPARLSVSKDLAPLRDELTARRLPTWLAASRAVPLVSDWQLIEPWSSSIRNCAAGNANQVVLPPVPAEQRSKPEERWLVALPSYVAALLFEAEALPISQLSALEVAGLSPTLRRSLSERATTDANIAELTARSRIKLALRAFQPEQAREAARLARNTARGADKLIAFAMIGEVLGDAPAGIEAWTSCASFEIPNLERLVQVDPTRLRYAPDLTALESVADRLGNQAQFERLQKLARKPIPAEWAKIPQDPALAVCNSLFLRERGCGCPYL